MKARVSHRMDHYDDYNYGEEEPIRNKKSVVNAPTSALDKDMSPRHNSATLDRYFGRKRILPQNDAGMTIFGGRNSVNKQPIHGKKYLFNKKKYLGASGSLYDRRFYG